MFSKFGFIGKKLSALATLILLALFFPNYQSFAETQCLIKGWPSEFSDLNPDSSLIRGTLPNGLRYVLKKNSEPKDRVALFLLVNAGSFNEKDEQRGAAHFLEHMMFNGSENFPPGTLVKYFQSIGMAFGGDTNAFTTYDRTVYNIMLPRGTEEDLDGGLRVMSDYAGRALLLEDEIDKERGVILSEKRARDSAQYRTYVASTEYAFKGSRLPERQVIGVDETLHHMNRKTLKAFYDEWYRPDNMVLVAVGDFDPEMGIELIQKNFSDLKIRSDSNVCPDFGRVGKKPREPFYHMEAELGKTEVSVEAYSDQPLENDSYDLQKQELTRHISTMIMGYRIQKIEEKDKRPFTKGAYYVGDLVDRIGYSVISGQADNNDWQTVLQAIVSLQRQALIFGFLPEEIERAKQDILAHLEENALTEKTKDSRRIGRDIVNQLASNRVYMSAEQELEIYGKMLEQITADEVEASYKKAWERDNLLVSVTGDTIIEPKPRQAIDLVFNEANKKNLTPPESYVSIDFPYLVPQKSSLKIPEPIYFKDIGVERYVFANGLIVNLKQTDYEKDKIKIAVSYGNGELEEPAPGMALLAERVINDSGTQKMVQSTLDRLVSGSSVSLGFKIGESSFSWNGQALSEDFKLLVEILYAVLYDPGFRESVYGNTKAKIEMMYKQLSRNIDGAFPLKIQSFLAGNSSKFGLPPIEDVDGIDFSELARWVQHFTPPKDLEISVVGDFESNGVLAMLAKYFGSQDFTEKHNVEAPQIVFPAGKHLVIDINTEIDKSLVVVAWPTVDANNINKTRRLNVLASIFEDRIRDKLRESLGATYSPETYSYGSRVYKGFGYIITQLIVAPEQVELVVGELSKLCRELAVNGVTDDEVQRARDPIVTSIKESIENNNYWLYSVMNLSARHPEQLEWPKTIIGDFESIGKTDIDRLAKRYLSEDNNSVVIANPQKIEKEEHNLATSDSLRTLPVN